jgi:hypothetical protein
MYTEMNGEYIVILIRLHTRGARQFIFIQTMVTKALKVLEKPTGSKS